MKTVLFLRGRNGIGKTAICKAMMKMRLHSAYVDSDLYRMKSICTQRRHHTRSFKKYRQSDYQLYELSCDGHGSFFLTDFTAEERKYLKMFWRRFQRRNTICQIGKRKVSLYKRQGVKPLLFVRKMKVQGV